MDSVPDAARGAAANPALDDLLKAGSGLWRGRDRYNDEASVATGFATLDALLPSRGWPIGGVTELLVTRQGIGETSLLLPALKRVTTGQAAGQEIGGAVANASDAKAGQWAALINPPWVPYAPALANAGLRLDRLLIVDARNDDDALWSAEQVLRAGLFAAVVVWVGRSTAQKQRRLQLAAEAGRTWATVYRPARAADEHSPVSLRMRLDTDGSQLAIETLKVRGGTPGRALIAPTEFDAPQGVEWPGLPVVSMTPDGERSRAGADRDGDGSGGSERGATSARVISLAGRR